MPSRGNGVVSVIFLNVRMVRTQQGQLGRATGQGISKIYSQSLPDFGKALGETGHSLTDPAPILKLQASAKFALERYVAPTKEASAA